MIMPICQGCGEKWSWSQTVRKLLSFKKGMRCYYCGKLQYQNKSSRDKMYLYSLLPVLGITLFTMFDITLVYVILLELSIFIMTILFMPFLLQLSNKDEPLW